ncbi:MAG: PcfJ domain-containing protein [Verrucomicrobiae bacterium]|nr:PcfJ domain-containing protein [Verrucomicrobiae bacterium]
MRVALSPAMPRPFTPPDEPGFRFSDGKLRIFQGDSIIVIHAWPELEAVRKAADSPWWEPFQPGFRLVKPYRPSKAKKPSPKSGPEPIDQMNFGFLDQVPTEAPKPELTLAQQRKQAFDRFRFAMPKDVARAVEPFRSDQWPLLLMLRHDPSSLDLVLQNPALAYLLAKKLNGDRGLIASLKCGTLRQREILGCLDFPESNGAVNLFRKIDPGSVNGDNWLGLLSLLRSSSEILRQRLGHLPTINTGVVEILLNESASAAAGQRLLQEVAEDKRENYRARVVHLVTNTLQMQDVIQARRPVKQFADLGRLETVHRDVSEAYRLRAQRINEVRRHSHANFSRPPIPGVPGEIEPLTSPDQLVDEGETQGNCVASYAHKVERGDTFIYRVLKPQRCTLSIIRRASSGLWRIGELESKFNTPANDETERHVTAWLRRYQIEV